MAGPRRYYLTYDVTAHPDGLTADEVRGSNRGGCDAVIVASMLYPDDGSFSLALLSKDGRTGEEITDGEIFKVWVLMAKQLMESKTLGDGKQALCGEVFDAVAAAVRNERSQP